MPHALILAGAVAAGFVQGVSGFAFALVATLFWSGSLAPGTLAPLIVINSVAGQLLSVRSVIAAFDARRGAPMLLGGIVGTPIGVLLLPGIDQDGFRLAIGILLCLYCPVMLLGSRLPTVHRGGRGADAAIGIAGGVMGGIAGLSGVAPTLWIALRGGGRDVQRALIQTFLIVAQSTALLGYLVSGLITREVLILAAWTLPCVLIPSWWGTRLYTRIPGEAFRRLILILMLLSGLALLTGR